jgi:hypothetical protein
LHGQVIVLKDRSVRKGSLEFLDCQLSCSCPFPLGFRLFG